MIISFLNSQTTKPLDKTHKPLKFMILKNSLLAEFWPIAGKTETELIQMTSTAPKPIKSEGNNFNLIEYQIKLMAQTDRLYEIENSENIYYFFEERLMYGSKPDKDYFEKKFESILNGLPKTYEEVLSEGTNLIHSLVGLMMVYWNFYIEYKEISQDELEITLHDASCSLSKILTAKQKVKLEFFDLLSAIIKKEDLSDCFREKAVNMGKSFDNTYHLTNTRFRETFAIDMSVTLLFAAIKTNQLELVKAIIKFLSFKVPAFPVNMKVDKIHREVALMFLENRYELSKNIFPTDWITKETFEKFLDSRVTKQDKYFKIDCRFMLSLEDQNDLNVEQKIDEMDFFKEYYESMEFITENHELRNLISHPVLDLITRMKIMKYYRILKLNAFMFVTFFLIPLVCFLYNVNASNSENGWIFIFISFSLCIGLILVAIRELFQLIFVFKGFRKYFKNNSNIMEMSLVVSTIFLIYALYSDWQVLLPIVEVITIILMILVTTMSLPVLKFEIYMNFVRKVFLTYLNTFIIFLPFTLATFLLISMLFSKKFNGLEKYVETEIGGLTMKYVIMFAGEIGIESKDITGFFQGVGLTLILFMIINHVNLLLSMTINDIDDEMEKSKITILHLNAKKYISFGKIMEKIYSLCSR